MQSFYDQVNDAIYIIPNRCGSSFFRDIHQDDPNRKLLDLRDYLDQLDDDVVSHITGFTHENIILALHKMFKLDMFNRTKLFLLYRDPLVRYKSGLKMIMSVKELQTFQPRSNKDPVNGKLSATFVEQRSIALKHKINAQLENLIPFYCFNDPHTTPYMHATLMMYMIFYSRSTLLHIKDFSRHATAVWNYQSPKHALHRSKNSERADSDAELCWNVLCERKDFITDSEEYNNPIPGTYSFYEWLLPDTISYERLNKTGNVTYAEAQNIFMEGLKASQMTIVRNGFLFSTYADALKCMPEGPARSMLARHHANIGTVLTNVINYKWAKKHLK